MCAYLRLSQALALEGKLAREEACVGKYEAVVAKHYDQLDARQEAKEAAEVLAAECAGRQQFALVPGAT